MPELRGLLSSRSAPPIEKPERMNTTVLAVVEHWNSKGQRYAVLYAVDEDDNDWRTADDDSELSHDWNVVSWIYLPEL
jgi:hypothetical protein